MSKHLIKSSQKTIYLLIFIIGSAMVGMVIFSLYVGDKMNKDYAPLVEASKEIKLSITESHLWLEEILSGDEHEQIEKVWRLFDRAEWYINAMLKGGENDKSIFVAVKEEYVIKQLQLLHVDIKRLREIAEQRLNAKNTSNAGSEFDQYYDSIYKLFKEQADLVEDGIYQLRNERINQFRFIQKVIISLSLIFFVVFNFIVYHFDNKSRAYISQLNSLNNDLEGLVEERTSKLEISNEELKKSAEKTQIVFDKLVESEKQYRFLTENSYDVVLAYDSDLNRTYVSPSIERQVGYTVEETVQSSFMEMAHPEDRPILLNAYNEVKTKKLQNKFLKYRRKTKHKGYIWLEVAISAIYDDQNNLKNVIINSRDISEQVKAEEDLKAAQTKLLQSDKMASLGLLTAGIAHEINNPINFVYAGINSLEDNLKDIHAILDLYEQVNQDNVIQKLAEIQKIKTELHFDKLLHFAERSASNIKKGAERTTEIIKGLSSFSRADEGKLILTNICEILDNALLLLRNQYKDRVTIIKEYNQLPEIECYPGKLNQVFVNVVSNAIHSIKELGTITIGTRISKKKGEDFVEVSITDTGKGMSKELQDKIFEPFFTSKGVGEGTGLGLSISHGIIENHNGFIEVESEVGKGTTFKIYLPT